LNIKLTPTKEKIAMSLFPTTAGADIISGFTTIVTANMGTVLAVFAALFGVSWVLARLNKARKGRI